MFTVHVKYIDGKSGAYKIRDLKDIVSCDNGHIMIYFDDDITIIGRNGFCSIVVNGVL